MSKQWKAIVYKTDRVDADGTHLAGDVFSYCSVIADVIPDHLEVVNIDHQPEKGEFYNKVTKRVENK